ncbi:integrase [Solimonas sp. C16B3]|uniref:Integrase n=1 Tax=Solimonas marina TaxID=2714601 RepID=A0A969W8P2_9GAMM|nr:integrase [Solimonas marina]
MTTIGALLDRYALEVIPAKAAASQESNRYAFKQLRPAFGEMPLTPFPPKLVYKYVDKRSAKIAAHREVEVLSHAFTKAVEWGLIDRHPFKGEVRLKGEKSRSRYVEDWEVEEAMKVKPMRKRGSVRAIQAYIVIKLMTGISQGDLLRLQPKRDFRADGIHVLRHKTKNSSGKATIYEWTPELQQAVDIALAARPVDIAPWLFCTRTGDGYINEETGKPEGWKSMWARFMGRVLAETAVKERFTEHDLRAKVASDADTLERARALLSHVDDRITRRVYRRKPERVTPLNRPFRVGSNDTGGSE